ncbi:hypothetical protein Tco_0845728 [Tanacetum coccineum]
MMTDVRAGNMPDDSVVPNLGTYIPAINTDVLPTHGRVAPDETIPNLGFTIWSENQALIGANEELRALIWEMRRKESAAEHLCDDLQDVILARDNQISSHMNEIDHLRYERRRMSEISALEEEVVCLRRILQVEPTCLFRYIRYLIDDSSSTKVGGNMSRVQAWTEIIDKVKSRLSIGIKDLLQLEVGVIKGFYGVDGEWAMGIYDILERRYLDLAAAFEALIPRVYALEILKDADNLYEALRAPRLDNYFRRSIRGGIEQSQGVILSLDSDDLQDVILARDNQISSYMNEIDQLRYEGRRMLSEIFALEEEVARLRRGQSFRRCH